MNPVGSFVEGVKCAAGKGSPWQRPEGEAARNDGIPRLSFKKLMVLAVCAESCGNRCAIGRPADDQLRSRCASGFCGIRSEYMAQMNRRQGLFMSVCFRTGAGICQLAIFPPIVTMSSTANHQGL